LRIIGQIKVSVFLDPVTTKKRANTSGKRFRNTCFAGAIYGVGRVLI
jgi:hypothetical protein